MIQERTVQIVDEFTGRVLHGRRYSEGLHQAIEAKEGIKVARRNRTLATITFQNFFRLYNKISGMTGTADTEAKEFSSIYKMDVVVIPTNRPIARKDEDDVIFLNESFKYKAICDEIAEVHAKGQPLLVGTVSIEKSELLAKLLVKRGIRHEILNAKNHSREALIIAEAGAKGSVTIATNMAGRGTDIKLGGSPEFRATKKAGTKASPEEYARVLKREREKWRSEYEEVRSLGGLYILGTERHESRRIDNQLRGTVGPAGRPGGFPVFPLPGRRSDAALRPREHQETPGPGGHGHGGSPSSTLGSTRPLSGPNPGWRNGTLKFRKHLLEYDDVLNEQRRFIYDQRNIILEDTDLKARILASAEEILEDGLEDFREHRDKNTAEAAMALAERMKTDFFYSLPFKAEELNELLPRKIEERILEDFQANLREKEEKIGVEPFNQIIRQEYLRNIDNRWQDHLEGLEALREAVYLRSYAQKNPLLEYKLEGFEIFDKLIRSIKEELAKKLIKVRIEKAPGHRQRGPVGMSANHAALDQFGGASTSRGEAPQANPQGATMKRNVPQGGPQRPLPLQ